MSSPTPCGSLLRCTPLCPTRPPAISCGVPLAVGYFITGARWGSRAHRHVRRHAALRHPAPAACERAARRGESEPARSGPLRRHCLVLDVPGLGPGRQPVPALAGRRGREGLGRGEDADRWCWPTARSRPTRRARRGPVTVSARIRPARDLRGRRLLGTRPGAPPDLGARRGTGRSTGWPRSGPWSGRTAVRSGRIRSSESGESLGGWPDEPADQAANRPRAAARRLRLRGGPAGGSTDGARRGRTGPSGRSRRRCRPGSGRPPSKARWPAPLGPRPAGPTVAGRSSPRTRTRGRARRPARRPARPARRTARRRAPSVSRRSRRAVAVEREHRVRVGRLPLGRVVLPRLRLRQPGLRPAPSGLKPNGGSLPDHGSGTRQPSRPGSAGLRPLRCHIGSWRSSSGMSSTSHSPSSSPW